MITASGRIDLVTFDLYDTLVEAVPPRWERFATAVARVGLAVSADRFRVADRAAEDYYTAENGQVPIRDRTVQDQDTFRLAYTRTMLEAAGIETDAALVQRVRDIYRGELDAAGWNYRVFDDVVPALELLESNGVKRAVISNADADVTEFCLHLGFAAHMDLIVTSALVGWEKPDPRTFHAALEPLAVEPEAAIHIGDQALSDVIGAHRVGMGAALIDRYGRHGADEHPDAIVVNSLLHLAEGVVAHNRQFALR